MNQKQSVLIVDDEKNIGKVIIRLLRQVKIPCTYVPDGQQALAKMRQAKTPYALVITDQRMPEMPGDAFLEQAARIAPDTVRFLMSGYTDLDAVIRAVNKGAINRFIPKPWNDDDFIRAVLSGIEQFETGFEARRLFEVAKTQNLKLFDLYKELKRTTAAFEKKLAGLTREIDVLTREIDTLKDPDVKYKTAVNRIELAMGKKQILSQAPFDRFVAQIREEIFIQFRDIAVRNGLPPAEIAPWKA